ncbi:serine/threonine-protein kinase [Vulgatibacter incomptus]|uniref:Serine/threonine protein kinase PrkC, regulator of stationary phase n=1 Tax=Vulgatibacter incomptus TaxID=1391653 RepID=A0A0K1PBU6_9BACT|nr:serine/threonine-protein kinase [Vulgatibacter incomptus]AKU90972.1 Serine/threonine protein kinase PrkC, regulator of stationary phase [Vulgatibacter incomptus]
MPTEQPARFGRFELLSRIGRGGMAEVSRAVVKEGPGAGRAVAVKRLLPEYVGNKQYVELFCAEAELSKSLVHPNIVEVLESGQVDGTFFMAMEFVDGRDLGAILGRCRERQILLPVDFALFLTHQLLLALDAAHKATSPTGQRLHVVHCDVSPSNLFISKTGEIKLGDFGIAKVRSVDPSRRKGIWGKVHYASPELLRNEDVLPQADVWAAAVMLYELLTLCRPFAGETIEEIGKEILDSDPPAVTDLRPEIPEAVESVLRMALHPVPDQRFHDAGAFAMALHPLFDDQIGTPLAIAAVVRGLFGA